MGGFFGVVADHDCVCDIFYGTDYHSHLGTKRGGLAVCDPENRITRRIHDITNAQFRSKFDDDIGKFSGNSGIGIISDYEDQPLIISSKFGTYAIVTVGKINNIDDLARQAFERGFSHFSESSYGELNPTEITAMLIDHIGGAFFQEVGVFRWIGRLAFPIFCYCLTVGLLYTHDVRKYLTRLGIFALVSQPFYILAFHPVGEFWANLTNWNIFFTLFLSLLGMYGLKERKWWLFALALFTVSWWNFDYSGTGIQLMLIFYLCRNRPRLGAALYLLSYLPALMNGWPEDPLCLTVGGLCIDWSIFAVFAAPLIFCATHSRIKINRWFFYAFYPAHLAAIALAGNIL